MDGFLSTWDKARNTFGHGAPPNGEQFDESARLDGLGHDVRSAATDSDWTGTASAAFRSANADLHHAIGTLADLDRALAVQLDRCAGIITAGRDELDAVRRRVQDAAAAVPAGSARERLLMSIVGRGLGELTSIVTTSQADLSALGRNIRAIGEDYRAVRGLGPQR